MTDQRQTERNANEITRRAADQAAQISRAMSETTEHAGRAMSNALRRNAETFNNTCRSSSEAAGRIVERSMEQFSNFFGLSGDTARQSVQNSSASVQALIDSSTVVASGMQNVSSEWARFLEQRAEQNLKGCDELMACRTVQDCLAIQTRMVRDNVEASLQSARRTSELSTKLADDAVRQMSDSALAAR